MFGFEFMKNFDSPYQADSITDFWRRWHISLSTFLRDYLYIPLGGNRKGPLRTYVNLIVVMLLGGLWHGANWTFVAWGAYHGILLAFERSGASRALYHRLPRPSGWRPRSSSCSSPGSCSARRTSTTRVNYLGAMFGRGGSTGPGSLLLPALLYTQGTLLIMAIAAVVVAWPVQAHDWSREITWPKASSCIRCSPPRCWRCSRSRSTRSCTSSSEGDCRDDSPGCGDLRDARLPRP